MKRRAVMKTRANINPVGKVLIRYRIFCHVSLKSRVHVGSAEYGFTLEDEVGMACEPEYFICHRS
jgi:hypothetical protein